VGGGAKLCSNVASLFYFIISYDRGQIPSAQARKALHVALERVARKALQVALERVARNMLVWLLVCTSLQLTLAQEPTASWRPNFTPLGLFCYKGEHAWLCCLISF
jgi:hypothetical protein